MTNSETDATSDAARSNPDVADKARDDLRKEAEEGMRKAVGGSRYREDVDTNKTPEDERREAGGKGVPGAITK